jgi:stage III sporulation protein AG
MEYINKIKEYILGRGTKKNIQDLATILIIGLIAVISINFFIPNNKQSPGYIEIKSNNEQIKNVNVGYEEQMKQELTDVLSQIAGVGKVSVMIYFVSGSEAVPAYSKNDSTKVTEENDGNGGKRITNENNDSTVIVTTNEGGGSRPFVLKELKPQISGIIVIAEGASNPDVKYKLYEAVKTVFNLQQYRVNIYPMQKK